MSPGLCVLCVGTLKCMPAEATAAWPFTYRSSMKGQSGALAGNLRPGTRGPADLECESIGSGMTADRYVAIKFLCGHKFSVKSLFFLYLIKRVDFLPKTVF